VMTLRAAMATTAAALVALLAAAVPGQAETSKRPRGVVEDCSRISGFGQGPQDFRARSSLVVGPLAVLRATPTLAYVPAVGGNKVFVVVRGGHRVTLELSRETRREVGFVFGPYPDGQVDLAETRRVVTFVACRRGEVRVRLDGWPVSGWVGGLLATSARCVPLRVWIDDEPRPLAVVLRFGVPDC
jgi:hypothetical protein